MNLNSPFEKLSIENQQRTVAAVEITATSVSPGGHMFGIFTDMLSTLKRIEKNTAKGKGSDKSRSGGTGVGSAILMSIIGAKALTGIGKGLAIIADAVNKFTGEPKEVKEKLEAVAAGINALTQIGPSVVKFAGYLLLATPMLMIGAIAAPLFAVSLLVITGALMIASKPLTNKKTQEALAALGGIGKSIFMFGAFLALSLLVYPFALAALPMVALVVLGVGGVFFLLDKLGITDSIEDASKALMFAGLAIITLGGSIALFSLLMSTVSNPMESLLILGAAVLGVSLAFGIAGMFWASIAKGAIALTLASIPIILLGYGVSMFAKAVSPDESGWITLAQIGAAIVGVGAAMALAGAAAVFILPGAATMIVAGLALISIAAGLAAFGDLFNGGGMEEMLADSGHVTEGFLGFGAGRMMSNMEWAMLSVARSFTLPIRSIASMYASAPALILAGAAMLSISKGVKAIQALNIDYETVPANISKLITAVASPFAEFGKDAGAGGRKSLYNRIFGGGSQSALADGISSVMGIGDALTSIAVGTQAMVNLKFPIYKGTKIVGYNTLQNGFEDKIATNLKMIINAVVAPFAEIGSDPMMGKGGRAGFFQRLTGSGGQSPVADGISAVQGIGSALTGIAEGVQAMANLTFPIYNAKGKKIGVRTIKPKDLTAVGVNLENIVKSLTSTFAIIGKNPDAETTWWGGNSKIQNGIELVAGMGKPLSDIAGAVKTFASENVDVDVVSLKIKKMIKALTGAFSGKNIEISKVALIGLYKTGKYLQQIAKSVDGFEKYTESFSKYVKDFIKYKDAVNDFDHKNLKLTTDMFQGLSYLARTEDAIGDMSDQLTSAIEKLSEMISNLGGNISSANSATATAAPTGGATTATSPSRNNKIQQIDIEPIVAAIQELEDRLNRPLRVQEI